MVKFVKDQMHPQESKREKQNKTKKTGTKTNPVGLRLE